MLTDFRYLARGTTPSGTPIAQDSRGKKWQFVLLFAKADEATRSDDWGLKHYNSVLQNCPECLADRDGLPYTDLQPSAKWRATEILDSEIYLSRIRDPKHPLARCSFT